MNTRSQTNHYHQAGLTFVELLIASAVLAIIMGGLSAAFISQSRMSISEEELIDLQMNLRIATDRLSNILAHTGFGCFDSFGENQTMSGNDPDEGSIIVTSAVSHINNNNSSGTNINSDSLIIVYGFKQIAMVDSIIDDNIVKLDSTPSPSITTGDDYKRYLSFFPSLEGNRFFQVTTINGRDVTLSSSVDVEEDYSVFMVSPVRIALANDSLYAQIFAYQAAVASDQYWLIAENIEDMQFQYHMEGQWWDQIDVSDLQNISKIRFWLLGRSSNTFRQSSSQVYEFVDFMDNIGDPSACVESFTDDDIDYCVVYRVGPFNDGNLRMVSRSEVVLRNAR